MKKPISVVLLAILMITFYCSKDETGTTKTKPATTTPSDTSNAGNTSGTASNSTSNDSGNTNTETTTSTTNSDLTPIPNPLDTMTFLGVVAGSSGNLSIELQPGTTDGLHTAAGTITFVLDGEEHLLTPADDDIVLADWQEGENLEGAKFEDTQKKIVIEIDTNFDGSAPVARIFAQGHDNIASVLFNNSEEEVVAYEGTTSSYTPANHLLNEQVFNLLLKPEAGAFRLVFKNDILGKADYRYGNPSAAHYSAQLPQTIDGTFSQDGNTYSLTYTLSFSEMALDGTVTNGSQTITVNFSVSDDGNTLSENITSSVQLMVHKIVNGDLVPFAGLPDSDGDTIPDALDPDSPDSDNDGIPDPADVDVTGGTDSDGNGMDDAIESQLTRFSDGTYELEEVNAINSRTVCHRVN